MLVEAGKPGEGDGDAEKRAVLRGQQPQVEVDGNTETAKGQPSVHLEPRDSAAASTALSETRQSGSSRPRAPYPHSPDEPSTAVAEVSNRCECCDVACTLASLSTFGYTVQRKGSCRCRKRMGFKQGGEKGNMSRVREAGVEDWSDGRMGAKELVAAMTKSKGGSEKVRK